MYVVTSMPPEMRTRATLRSAEFGFLGVVVYTRVQTPRRCGAATFFLRPLPDLRPGVASFFVFGLRPLRTSWDVVGIRREMLAALVRALEDRLRIRARAPRGEDDEPAERDQEVDHGVHGATSFRRSRRASSSAS